MRTACAILILCTVAVAQITINNKPAPPGTTVNIVIPTTPIPDPEPQPDPQPGAESPTGRAPKFLWSKEWQAGWQKAKAENHPWWVHIKTLADGTDYNDNGQWATLVYQITGDITYAQKALPKVIAFTAPKNANHVREFYIEALILYDRLLPAMTVQQKADFDAAIKKLAEYSLGINQPAYTGGFALADSDQTVGQYFGLALTDIALGTDYLTRTSGGYGSVPVVIGGLDPTTDGKATARNTVKSYFEKSAGGQWIESTEYNLGTNMLVLMGVGAIRTATGQEHFPESVPYFAALRQSMMAELTPDLSDSFQWGDVEEPHTLHLFHRSSTMIGLGLHGILEDKDARPRGFYFTTPYDPLTKPPATQASIARGVGAILVKDSANLFASHMANRTNVHHEVNYLNTFQLWHDGEWVIDHPRGYSTTNGNTVNGMLLAGLSSMKDRRCIASAHGPGFAYQVGVTGGTLYDPAGYWNPPPAFVRQWKRSVVYLSDYPAVVVYDDVDMDDPKKLGKMDRYETKDAAAITGAPALRQWFLHTPVVPEIVGNKATWQTAGGQTVTLATLAPPKYTPLVVDESLDPAFSNGFHKSELKRHIVLRSDDAKVFCNVISIGDELPAALVGNVLTVADYKLTFGAELIVEKK